MAILVLLLWLATAVAGVTLLRAGGEARRLAASAAGAEAVQAEGIPAGAVQAGAAQPVPAAGGLAARLGAIPLTDEGKPPPGPHNRVVTPAGEHPLLEFSHPALAVVGIACWTMFTFIHYRPLAWIAFGVLVVTLGMGLGWLASTRRAARHPADGSWAFPRRLVLTHGAVAGCSIVLTVLTALLAAGHG